MHIKYPHLAKRQAPTDALPSANGLGTAVTAASLGDTHSTLLLGGTDTVEPSVSVPLVAGEPTITTTLPPTSTPTTSSTDTSIPSVTSEASSSSRSSSISTGAVIGIAVGVFAVLLIIIMGVYRYIKHSTPRTREIRSRNGPSSPSSARNANGDADRRRSRAEAWNKLGDEDQWEGKDGRKGGDGQLAAGADKFAMFEKDPSLRSNKALTSEGHGDFDPSTMPDFTKYTPGLASEFAQPPARPFVPRVDGSPVVSWDGETVGDDSFLSMRSVRMSSDAMSPTAVLVKQTPLATTSQPHLWESAEVITEDTAVAAATAAGTPAPGAAEPHPAEHPFAEEEARKSFGNPFFNAQSFQRDPFSDSHSVPKATRSRKSSVASVGTVQAVQSELQRADSTASDASTVRGQHHAMQSLIAALDFAPPEGDDALHRSSMQTSESLFLTAENESIISVPQTPKAV
ncbi:hypothetical protein FA95DRAFT_84491 [Auriscalpium vulgare]|uniref:Uncharacterized protein n=1 Tax=Auriscalpium vulgare TaxID=40419 RepID=A0ACB8RPB3_9AGAM|nr:hypothetical protein FA95DRAFT_84491 [Auriscalpium vulgare]